METANAKPINVLGYLAGNWPGINEENPALIVNPQASPLDLLAWCWGEAMSLEASALALTAFGAEIKSGELAAIFQHRLSPLANVLGAAVDALSAQARVERQRG